MKNAMCNALDNAINLTMNRDPRLEKKYELFDLCIQLDKVCIDIFSFKMHTGLIISHRRKSKYLKIAWLISFVLRYSIVYIYNSIVRLI